MGLSRGWGSFPLASLSRPNEFASKHAQKGRSLRYLVFPRGPYRCGSLKTIMGKSIEELASYVAPLCEEFLASARLKEFQ